MAGWRKQATDSYIAGLDRAYQANRAPLFIGNHFEDRNGGIHMDAVEEALKCMAGKKDVRLVSFRQFVDWPDVQKPEVLAKPQSPDAGQQPVGGWNAYLEVSPRAPPEGSGKGSEKAAWNAGPHP